jgi:RNA polymerase sigma-70 factor (ECF subfamily)
MLAGCNAAESAVGEGPRAPARRSAGFERGLISSVQRAVDQPLFDEQFARALGDGDAEAETFLVEHFTRVVQIKLRARLRAAELIQDGVQETFLRVIRFFRSGKTLDNPAALPGFIHSVCQNVALELLRAHTRQAQIPENAPEAEDPGSGPESLAAKEERRRLVGRILDEMPEKDRLLLRRVCLEEEDKDQVCRDLHVDRGYLRVLLHRARVRFRAALAQPETSRGVSVTG